MTQHAIISPSKAHRVLVCHGSVGMEHGLPDTTSEYAEEGTRAHALAAALLTGEPFDGVPDADMQAHVATYTGTIRDLAQGGELLVEQRVPVGHVTTEEGACGTADAVILRDGELIVVDLKYGRGVQVDADNNAQLMLYALGALEAYGMLGEFHTARLVIVQPRLNHVSEWCISVVELLAWADAVRPAFAEALATINNVDTDKLCPDEDACRFCKAKAICPALAAKVVEVVGAEFDVIGEPGAALPAEIAVGPDDLTAKMHAVGLIEDWCKAVRAEVERRLLAGIEVPDYKLVAGRAGNRAWANAAEAEAMLKSMRLKQDEMYDFKLISPTTAEKLATEGKIGKRQWPKLQALITRADGKPSVAPLSDKRPAVTIAPPEDSMPDLSAEELV